MGGDSPLESARAARTEEGRPPETPEEEQAALESLLVGADFTGLALGVLDEHVFERALQGVKALLEQLTPEQLPCARG
jgi:hypothetical protein